MAEIAFITKDGREYEVNAPLGETVMRVALMNGVPGIEAECGGALACATCRVNVPSEWHDRLSPASDNEMQMLEYCEDMAPATRLCCQIEVTDALDGLRLFVPETQY